MTVTQRAFSFALALWFFNPASQAQSLSCVHWCRIVRDCVSIWALFL